MAKSSQDTQSGVAGIDSLQVQIATLALLVAEREEAVKRGDWEIPAELVLNRAGLSIGEIAHLTGRKYESVRSALRRSMKGEESR
jgi:hypothetical protein